MKTASVATMNVIAAGNYIKVEFWQITLTDGQTYYFTAGQVPLSVASQLYRTGLIFVRDKLTQKVGLEVNSMNLTIEPQLDAPGGQPLIGGGNLLSQCRAGVLDGAIWLLSKGFFAIPEAGNQMDTSPGLVPWWGGITNNIQCGRYSAIVAIDETTAILNTVQMPRNMIQAGCVHQLFDVGCTVPKANNNYAGVVLTVSATRPNQITTSTAAVVNLDTEFNGAFNLGVMTFVTGVLAGTALTVSLSKTAGGVATLTTVRPFPTAPSAGDTFGIVVGCDKQFSTCGSGKFRNSADVPTSFQLHYRGCPFVPNPETLYDGGTGSENLASIGASGTPGAGSPFSGGRR
jgi:hypothetical protein